MLGSGFYGQIHENARMMSFWDTTPANDFFPTGAVLWLDAADSSTIVIGTSGVQYWNDKSGNGNHFNANAAGNEPERVANGVKFNNNTAGGDTNPSTLKYMGRLGFAPANPYLFVVIDSVQSKAVDHAIYAHFQSNTQYHFAGISNSLSAYYARTRNTTNYTASFTGVTPGAARVLVNCIWAGNNFRSANVNNSSSPAVNTSAASISPTAALIGTERGASGSTPASGLVATLREIILFSGAPAPSVVSATVSYLTTKWSIGGVSI